LLLLKGKEGGKGGGGVRTEEEGMHKPKDEGDTNLWGVQEKELKGCKGRSSPRWTGGRLIMGKGDERGMNLKESMKTDLRKQGEGKRGGPCKKI